jgi:hypothetical protein
MRNDAMKRFLNSRFGRLTAQDFDGLQAMLESSLTPVAPRNEFLAGLRAGLFARDIQMASFPPASRKISNGLLVAGGVLGSVLMIIASIRGLISLFALIGSIFQRLSKIPQVRQQQQTTPA